MTKSSFEKSNALIKRALKVIRTGTNSGARMTITRGMLYGYPIHYPKFFERAKDSEISDVDGNKYIDYYCGQGPVILGHAHPKVNEAVKEQIDKAVIFGSNHEIEVNLCEKIVKHVPCAERVQLLCTGSDATTVAFRLAKSYTGRQKFAKFGGHYHGWDDWTFYTHFNTGMLTRAGIRTSAVNDGILLPWNDLDTVEKTITATVQVQPRRRVQP